jgi:hypothetical protein
MPPTFPLPPRRFLNRLLGLPVWRQNLLFQYFQVGGQLIKCVCVWKREGGRRPGARRTGAWS